MVSVGNNFVVADNSVSEFTTNSIEVDTRRTVKTNNKMGTNNEGAINNKEWSVLVTTLLLLTTVSVSSQLTPLKWIPGGRSRPTTRCCHRLRYPRRHGQRRVPNQLYGLVTSEAANAIDSDIHGDTDNAKFLITSTDWLPVRLPMPSELAAASMMIALIARLRATTSATMQTGTTSTP